MLVRSFGRTYLEMQTSRIEVEVAEGRNQDGEEEEQVMTEESDRGGASDAVAVWGQEAQAELWPAGTGKLAESWHLLAPCCSGCGWCR